MDFVSLESHSSRETLRFSGNKIHCSPRDQSLSVYYLQTLYLKLIVMLSIIWAHAELEIGATPFLCKVFEKIKSAWSQWVFLLPPPPPLHGCYSIAGLISSKFVNTCNHLYTWTVERGTVRVNCLAHEHNTMFLARVWTHTAQSRSQLPNHALG